MAGLYFPGKTKLGDPQASSVRLCFLFLVSCSALSLALLLSSNPLGSVCTVERCVISYIYAVVRGPWQLLGLYIYDRAPLNYPRGYAAFCFPGGAPCLPLPRQPRRRGGERERKAKKRCSRLQAKPNITHQDEYFHAICIWWYLVCSLIFNMIYPSQRLAAVPRYT